MMGGLKAHNHFRCMGSLAVLNPTDSPCIGCQSLSSKSRHLISGVNDGEGK